MGLEAEIDAGSANYCTKCQAVGPFYAARKMLTPAMDLGEQLQIA